MHSRGNAIRIFGDARERDAGDAETREGARGMFGIFFGSRALARSSRGRRRPVDRTTTARRPGETLRVSTRVGWHACGYFV